MLKPEESIIFQHIRLFVNDYSVQMGEEGKEAINKLFKKVLMSLLFPNK